MNIKHIGDTGNVEDNAKIVDIVVALWEIQQGREPTRQVDEFYLTFALAFQYIKTVKHGYIITPRGMDIVMGLEPRPRPPP